MRWYGRLHRAGELAYVRRRGKHLGSATFTAFYAPSRDGGLRVAITVSKAVGIAVVRNRVRRQVQGMLDRSLLRPVGIRVIFVAKPAAAESPDGLLRDLDAALRRLVSGA